MMGDQDYKAVHVTPAGIKMDIGTMAPDATVDVIAEWSQTRGRLRASRHYRFRHGKVMIIDLQGRKEIELTEQQAQLLLDDLIACLVKPTLPAHWRDKVKFLFNLGKPWR